MDISVAILFGLVGFALNELHEYSLKKATKKAYRDGYKQARYEEEIRNETAILNRQPKIGTYYPADENHKKKGEYKVNKAFAEKLQSNGQATMILNNN